MPKANHPRFLYPESDGKPIADKKLPAAVRGEAAQDALAEQRQR